MWSYEHRDMDPEDYLSEFFKGIRLLNKATQTIEYRAYSKLANIYDFERLKPAEKEIVYAVLVPIRKIKIATHQLLYIADILDDAYDESGSNLPETTSHLHEICRSRIHGMNVIIDEGYSEFDGLNVANKNVKNIKNETFSSLKNLAKATRTLGKLIRVSDRGRNRARLEWVAKIIEPCDEYRMTKTGKFDIKYRHWYALNLLEIYLSAITEADDSLPRTRGQMIDIFKRTGYTFARH